MLQVFSLFVFFLIMYKHKNHSWLPEFYKSRKCARFGPQTSSYQALTKNTESVCAKCIFPYNVLVVLFLNFRNKLAYATDISMP